MRRRILSAVILSSVATFAHAAKCTLSLNAQSQITVVGAYSNMRYTSEPAYGFTVGLWHSGGRFSGLRHDAKLRRLFIQLR